MRQSSLSHVALPRWLWYRRSERHGYRHGSWPGRRTDRRALSIGLAFAFGYLLSLVPVIKAGVSFGSALRLVLAADTLSITTMKIVGQCSHPCYPQFARCWLDEPAVLGEFSPWFGGGFRRDLPGQSLSAGKKHGSRPTASPSRAFVRP